MVAAPWRAGSGGFLAAIRRALRAVSLEPCGTCLGLLVRRHVRDLGLAHSVLDIDRAGGDRIMDPPRYSGDLRVPAAGGEPENRAGPRAGNDQEATEGNHPFRAPAHGRAGAVLHLPRVYFRLCSGYPQDVA